MIQFGKILVLSALYGLCCSLFAQTINREQDGEILYDMHVNPVILKENSFPVYSMLKTANSCTCFFLLDTLNLPFIDDFSKNRQKDLNPTNYQPVQTVDSIAIDFLADGIWIDTLRYSADTTWSYLYDTNGAFLSKTHTILQIEVILYNDGENPFNPSPSIKYWKPFYVYDTIGDPNSDTIYIAIPSVLANSMQTLKVYPPDTISLWSDDFAFINNSYPVNPVTIGVATLDGINASGHPYDFANPESYGVADYLTSNPIDLNGKDSVYISFYYQPQGLGNNPQPEDSLVLELFAPGELTWFGIWRAAGASVNNFKQVMLPVSDSKYLKKGFKFRFKNYATLSGNFDHWNIDYVFLGAGRNINDTTIDDIALKYNSGSLLQIYQAVPWKHFLNDSSGVFNMATSITAHITNLDSTVANYNYKYRIINEQDSIFTYNFGSQNLAGFTQDSINSPVDYKFYSTSKDSATFTIDLIFKPQSPDVDINSFNDTAKYVQRFYNYYAYDDGTAEKGYGLVEGTGAQLAYKFTVSQPDTLRGLQMYFSSIKDDVSKKTFQLTVWNDNGGIPGTIIYQKTIKDKPFYENGLNRFVYYMLDEVLVVSGIFYVGWVQTDAESLNIGFDVNTNANSKMFFNVTGSWKTSVFSGSWMIRPMFGDTVIAPASAPEIKTNPVTSSFAVYPNPASDKIFMKINGYMDNPLDVSIVDLYGRIIFTDHGFRPDKPIEVSNLAEGIYIIRITDNKTGRLDTKKLVITKE